MTAECPGRSDVHGDAQEDVLVAQHMVEAVRLHTDACHADCNAAVMQLLDTLAAHSRLRHVQPAIRSIIAAVQLDTVDARGCADGQRLLAALKSLSEHKDDAQERSWQLHETADEVVDLLDQVHNILRLSDRRVAQAILPTDDYTHLLDLVMLFQMESRTPVRTALARALTTACSVDVAFVHVLLCSVLPVEVAAALANAQFRRNDLVSQCMKLLVYLFCTGAQPPFEHYDTFNLDFIRRLVALVESDSWCAELATNVLLAFNVHQRHSETNLCVEAVTHPETASAARFLERVLALFNDADDPSWPFGEAHRSEAARRHAHSEHATGGCFVDGPMQLLTDLFASSSATSVAHLLYTNDAHVLFDVLLRRCYDLPVGLLRTVHVELLAWAARAMRSSVAAERKYEILECVGAIDIDRRRDELDAAAVHRIEALFDADHLVTDV